MQNIKKLIFYLVVVSLSVELNATGFEGSITFVKETFYDTSYMVCYVKGSMIRLEEMNASKQIINVFLVDTQNETILLINPEKKLYSKFRQKPSYSCGDEKFSIQKTDNTKVINGETCYQWRVKCKESNAEVSYWVVQNDFFFFQKIAHIFDNTENNWKFFTQIPDSQGYFPMMCVERNLVRDEKQRTKVIKISRQQVNSQLFHVPTNYKPFIL